jgi:primosomal protein N' (replication factor Y)
MQTFMPEHYAIQAASSHDVEGFHAKELEYRRKLGYPPFARLVRLETRNSDSARAEAEARKLADRLKARLNALNMRESEIIGPVPAFFAKIDGIFRWQIILRGANPIAMLEGERLNDWRVEVDPISLL